MIPHRTPFFLPMIYPSLLWRFNTEAKELYLTFDDGPVEGPTEFVLETLAKASIKATFFCIGDNIRKHRKIFSNLVEAGHQVGNHTFHHVNGWKMNDFEYVREIELCEREFFTDAVPEKKIETKLFRPPYGRIRRSQIRAVRDEYKIVMWDVLSVDYSKSLSRESCLRNTLNVVRPGSIIVFHDSVKAERNLMYVLPRFIESCLAKGYSFKIIPA